MLRVTAIWARVSPRWTTPSPACRRCGLAAQLVHNFSGRAQMPTLRNHGLFGKWALDLNPVVRRIQIQDLTKVMIIISQKLAPVIRKIKMQHLLAPRTLRIRDSILSPCSLGKNDGAYLSLALSEIKLQCFRT